MIDDSAGFLWHSGLCVLGLDGAGANWVCIRAGGMSSMIAAFNCKMEFFKQRFQ